MSTHPTTTADAPVAKPARKRAADDAGDEHSSKRARTDALTTVTTTTTVAPGAAAAPVADVRLDVLAKVMEYMGVEEVSQLMPRIAVRAFDLAQKGLHFGQLSIDRQPYQRRVEQEGPNALIEYVLRSYELGVPFVAMGFSFKMRRYADHVTAYNLSVFTRSTRGDGETLLENAAMRSRWWKMAIHALHQDSRNKKIVFTADAAGWRTFYDRLKKCWEHRSLARYKVAVEGSWKRTFFKDSFDESVWLSVQKFWCVPEEDPAQQHLDAIKHNNSRRIYEIDLDEVVPPTADSAADASADLEGGSRTNGSGHTHA